MKDKFPPEVIAQWPEIFDDIEVKAVPVEYITSAVITLGDGKVWEIDLDQKKIVDNGECVAEVLDETLQSFFDKYDDNIESVDFIIDAEQVIKDIKERTKKFLKKRK